VACFAATAGQPEAWHRDLKYDAQLDDADRAPALHRQNLSGRVDRVCMRHASDRQALARFEVFLTAAVTTVVAVRAFLVVTGYPKVGGGGLHIAHVLWGGLLMAAAIVLVQVTPGTNARVRAARLGGIGFGLFIDEVGKFVTKDVNYFFRPAIAIIYVTFVGFYLVVREVVLRRDLTGAERLAIAATTVADMALGQAHSADRAYARHLLDTVDIHPDLVAPLRNALNIKAPRRRTPDGWLTRRRERLVEAARRVVTHPRFDRSVLVGASLQLLIVTGELVLLVVHPSAGLSASSTVTRRGGEIATIASAALAAAGIGQLLTGRRQAALHMLFRSVLVTLLVTQVFVFTEYQASGIIGLVVTLIGVSALRLAVEASPDQPLGLTVSPADSDR
jgi:hypothetical protein